ncbi:MAG TPA: S53 family peptidase [Streptosporangiaceae bacterium]|jgi:subtilase family serine protease|nr:S53 family peptidase [Streptosporangiaceae bacterium]
MARTMMVAVSALALATTSVAAASAAQAKSSPAAHSMNVRRVCAVNRTPGVMSCMALMRTDVKQHLEVASNGHDPAPIGDGYGPSSLLSAYNLASASSSSPAGERVAVVDAYNDPTAVSDLATYRSSWGLPACNATTKAGCLTVTNQYGRTTHLPADAGDTGWDVEESLDVDMVSAICPNCHIFLVEANGPTITALGTAVKNAVNKVHAKFVSNSYGGSVAKKDSTYDTDYYKHAGVAVTASAGDSGYGPAYPAASPWVTAVGGTSLVQTGVGRGWTETVWDGSGGGCNGKDNARPSWQKFAVTQCSHRLENDVAAIADPSTGVAIYDTYSQGGWLEVGGTSVASPIIASVFALAGNPTAGTYPTSYIYAHTSDLYDVTVGSNGSCSKPIFCNAETGYDGPTGWGTPNGTAAFTG